MDNQKYETQEQARNHAWIIVASNDPIVFKTREDARRYLIIPVSTCCQKNKRYFKDLTERVIPSQAPKFLHLLQGLDVSSFDHTKLPVLSDTRRQQTRAPDPAEPLVVRVPVGRIYSRGDLRYVPWSSG